MYALAFILTITIEGAVALLVTRDLRLATALACASAVSHPLAFSAVARGADFFLVEILVALGEAVLIAAVLPRNRVRNVSIVVLANIVTAIVGMLL